tara:strand:+ start:119 stop:1399 length:1281 start_codon:yes stop_codon:yes gene_type:complete
MKSIFSILIIFVFLSCNSNYILPEPLTLEQIISEKKWYQEDKTISGLFFKNNGNVYDLLEDCSSNLIGTSCLTNSSDSSIIFEYISNNITTIFQYKILECTDSTLSLEKIIYNAKNEILSFTTQTPVYCQQEQLFSRAIEQMPYYYNFIKSLKENGYQFKNFNYLVSNNFSCEDNTIVMRHDVHHRDINKARYMMIIEKELLDVESSTYFVMYNFPPEYSYNNYQQDYINFIQDCSFLGFDVQPHISINDLIQSSGFSEYWNNPIDTLMGYFNNNYFLYNNGLNYDLNVIKNDVFSIDSVVNHAKNLLLEYNLLWQSTTGLNVDGYASHGSSTPMNKVLNNAYILDLVELESSGIYNYDTYNTKIFNELKYYSDGYSASWMSNYQLVTHSKIQMLVHPNVWDNSSKNYLFDNESNICCDTRITCPK